MADPAPHVEPTGSSAIVLELATTFGLALYIARVGAEVLPGTRTAVHVAFLLAVGLVTAWFVTRSLINARIRRNELGLLLIYVVWPANSPAIAWAVGMLAVSLWVWRLPPMAPQLMSRLVRWLPEALTVIAGLVLYGSTVAPTLLPADAGEFQLVATTLGIAHPPGYPLYTVLGKIASLIPVGDAAYRVNWLSVVFAAATLGLIVRLVCVLPLGAAQSRGSAWAAILAAAALGTTPTFWIQATTANIRSMTALLTALVLVLAVNWAQSPSPRRLAMLGLGFGLAAGHHGSLALLGIPVFAYMLTIDKALARAPRRLLPALGGFVASLVVLLYLPLRSATQPSFDPAPIDSVSRFLEHVLASGFSGDMLYLGAPGELWERTLVYLQIMRLQFGSWLPWAMLLAGGALLWRQWRLGVLLVGIWAINVISAITYRAPQTVEYLLPSYVAMAAALGAGLRLVIGAFPRARRTGLLLALVSLLLASQGFVLWPDMQHLHTNTSTRTAAQRMLDQAPEDALILASWHQATPLWYLQMIEGMRPDVEVQYVYPEGSLPYEEAWLARIADAIDSRPVLVTNRFFSFAASPFIFEPRGDAWLARREPSAAPPDAAARVSAVLGERIRIEAVTAPRTGTPGETLRVALYWRPIVQLERDYAVSVQLLGPDGTVGQADTAQPTSSYASGGLRADAYELPLLVQTPPGNYQLIVGFYTVTPTGWERLLTSGGQDHVVLGEVTVSPSTLPTATQRPLTVGFEGGYLLSGLDLDHSVEGTTRVYLHWRRTHPAPGTALRILALDADNVQLASTVLPALRSGQTATTVMDLEGTPEVLHLALRGERDQVRRPLTVWRLPGTDVLDLLIGDDDDSRFVPLGGRMVFVDLVDEQDTVEPGEGLVVRPRMLALRPLMRDNSLSVGILGPERVWESKADGTPALGAIPTLKWMTNWQVTSYYTPVVPETAALGPARITLEAYDAFTLTPLAVLDERLAREGQGTYLVVGAVQVVAP